MEDTNLLLVDDDVDWGETTAALLEHERESLNVRYVSDADEAVEEFEEGFDCVLADYNMPGVDGIDLLEIVRDDYPDLPYILITSQGSEDVASEAVSKGVTDYIVKRPGDDQTDTIVNRVENAVRSYRAEKRVEELNRKIEELHGNASRIGESESEDEVYEEISRATEDVMGFDSMVMVEAEDNGFRVAHGGSDAFEEEGHRIDGSESGTEGDIVERVYTSRRSVVSDTGETEASRRDDLPLIATPVGKYGVLLVVSEEEELDRNDLKLIEVLSSHVESALERIESRQRIVEERNNKERMRSLLTSSSSRQEVEETVCEYLVEEEGYSLAWTGNVSENTPPKAFVRRNEEGDYLESVVFPVGSDGEDGDPGVRTAATGEVSVKSLKPDGFSGERASAVEETDLSTGASIPLVEGDVMYGVLTVYSDEEDGIDEKDIETLEEFGKSLSSAIKSREMEEGLTTDQPMRLELETGEHPLLEAAEDWGSLTVDSVVPRDDDFLYHVDIDEGVEIPSVEEDENEGGEGGESEDGDTDTETDLPDNVEKAEVISESDQGVTARVVAPGPTPEAVIADHGGMVVRTEIDGSATVVSKVSRRVTGDVTDSVRSQFDDVRLTAKKSSSDEGSEPLSLDWRIQKLLNDELTKKQFDSLRTAYKNGYFERPRRTNTTETAELLDLSRPTFVQHLRAAERKILGNLID